MFGVEYAGKNLRACGGFIPRSSGSNELPLEKILANQNRKAGAGYENNCDCTEFDSNVRRNRMCGRERVGDSGPD